jgi:deazaflavin-dependent oxidoreductase (nitroreductase family)
MLAMWRLGLGGWINFWPAVVGHIMVLVHVGRKTGIKRRTPLNFAAIDGDIYCIAAFGKISDWHKNVLADRRVEVWLPDGWWSGVATDVSDSASRLSLLREVLIASGFASYCAGIWPKSISDAELARRTGHYRVVRVELTHALTREGGPGDLAWVWPVVALALLVALFLC